MQNLLEFLKCEHFLLNVWLGDLFLDLLISDRRSMGFIGILQELLKSLSWDQVIGISNFHEEFRDLFILILVDTFVAKESNQLVLHGFEPSHESVNELFIINSLQVDALDESELVYLNTLYNEINR